MENGINYQTSSPEASASDSDSFDYIFFSLLDSLSTTVAPKNSSTEDSSKVIWHGILACFFGAFCFGTMHVPIRRFHNSSDGFFVQWIMSLGILIMGFIINMTVSSPPMKPMAIFGGILWTFANSLAQYVICHLGLAVALLLWSTTNCLTGWSSGRFGLFGLRPQVPNHNLLNIIGLVIVLSGGIAIAFIKKNPSRFFTDVMIVEQKEMSSSNSSSNSSLQLPIGLRKPLGSSSELINEKDEENSCGGCVENGQKSPTPKSTEVVLRKNVVEMAKNNVHRLFCIFLALLSGFFYGATVIPVIYMQDHQPSQRKPSRNGLPYIFSHYFGIFLGSTAIFIFYAIVKKNKPVVNPLAILPSLLGGMIWGTGMIMLFISNDILTQTITYPVLTTVPGCIAVIWSVLYFKEIALSRHNIYVLIVAFSMIFTGAIMVFISKIKFDFF